MEVLVSGGVVACLCCEFTAMEKIILTSEQERAALAH